MKHSCSGKQILDPGERTATCYECGRRVPASPVPIDIGFAHLAADVRGYGLRSGRRR